MTSPAGQQSQSSSSYTSYFPKPVKYAVSSALRRFSADPYASTSVGSSRQSSRQSSSSNLAALDRSIQAESEQQEDLLIPGLDPFPSSTPPLPYLSENYRRQQHTPPSIFTATPAFTPPRNIPPFQPPPLTSLTLTGYNPSTFPTAQLLTRLLAEEIRLLMPPRIQLASHWTLAFGLAQHGASLHTLYERCAQTDPDRGGWVLAVRDASGGTFGAYLTHPPAPSNGHYYGTGESFLWRATSLAGLSRSSGAALPASLFDSLPPPPSADTTHATRSTTLAGTARLRPAMSTQTSRSGTSTPERIRFKAFPYSGENDYVIFCEQRMLSVGGGDGHYGLWLDASLERGVSEGCPTFGNEALSDDGSKFEVLGVEVWHVGG